MHHIAVVVALVAFVIAGCATDATRTPTPSEIIGAPPAAQAQGAETPPSVDVHGLPLSETEERIVSDPARMSHVPGMSRKKITLDVRDADVHNVLRFLAQEGGVNIVVDQTVSGRVTMRLKNVTVEDAFLTVLESLGLGFTYRGEIVSVGSSTDG